MTSIGRKLLRPLKPLYHSTRNFCNQRRYASLWRKRRVVQFSCGSIPIYLVVVDPNDLIQKVHSKGQLYEAADIEDISPYFRRGGVFVDIGANTGQHSIYFAKVLGASKLILFEPIRQTCQILRENIRLNNLEGITDLSHLGIGLGDKSGRAMFAVEFSNLGGATLFEQSTGSIETKAGDSVLEESRIDFIKIDTEGFEIKVLAGLDNTIRIYRPVIYIEVDRHNDADFERFLHRANYRIEKRHKNYAANENFLVLPN